MLGGTPVKRRCRSPSEQEDHDEREGREACAHESHVTHPHETGDGAEPERPARHEIGTHHEDEEDRADRQYESEIHAEEVGAEYRYRIPDGPRDRGSQFSLLMRAKASGYGMTA